MKIETQSRYSVLIAFAGISEQEALDSFVFNIRYFPFLRLEAAVESVHSLHVPLHRGTEGLISLGQGAATANVVTTHPRNLQLVEAHSQVGNVNTRFLSVTNISHL